MHLQTDLPEALLAEELVLLPQRFSERAARRLEQLLHGVQVVACREARTNICIEASVSKQHDASARKSQTEEVVFEKSSGDH